MKYAEFVLRITGLLRGAYAKDPAAAPKVFTVTDPPGTSSPVAASTSFTKWLPVSPALTYRPRALTVKDEPPTVKPMPTQPV